MCSKHDTPLTQGLSPNLLCVFIAVSLSFAHSFALSHSLGCCICLYLILYASFLAFALSLSRSGFFSFSNSISFCPSIRLNIFHPKCQIKVRIFYRNNNRSASIVRLNNRWKVSMKCGGKGFKKQPESNTFFFFMYPRLAFVQQPKKKKIETERENIITNATFSCMHLLPTNSQQ